MLRRALLAGLPLVFLAGGAAAETHEAGQFVDLAPVALPIVANGRLVNYVFVYVRINLTPSCQPGPVARPRAIFSRRARSHRPPQSLHRAERLPADRRGARLKAELFQAASQITGPGQVASVEIMPGGGPMRRTGLPASAQP